MSDAQHADLAISNLEKANRSQSRKRSLRRSRERKRIVKLTTRIDSLEIGIAKMQRVALSQQRIINALRSQTEDLAKNIRSSTDALRMEINHLMLATEEAVRQQQERIMPFCVPHNFALNPQQQAAQAIAHALMQQEMMSSQLQVQMQFQPQVMMPSQDQGLFLSSSWPNVTSWFGGEAATGEGAHATPDQHMDTEGRPESSLAGGDVATQGPE